MENDTPVVLITGASRGIGREIALGFAKKKYRVAVNFIASEEKAKSVGKEILELGGEALLLRADIGEPSEVKGMVEELFRKWGRIDVLINNAATTRNRTILKMSDHEWKEVMRTNLDGTFWCLRECAKVMARQKRGSIINISSIAAIKGAFGWANYAASKSALLGLTKSAARELGRFNICVNALLPGFHLTDMSHELWKMQEKEILSQHVLGKLVDPKEFVNFVIFIAEQKSASGQVFNFESRIV